MKTTVRLPDDLAAALRARSRQEQRSLNATLVGALRRGLDLPVPPGDERPEDILGDLVLRPAERPFDLDELRAELPHVSHEEAAAIEDALEWTRADRWF